MSTSRETPCMYTYMYIYHYKAAYYNQLNTQFQRVILQLKHYISNMFRSFSGRLHGDHTSVKKYETQSTIKFSDIILVP